MFSTRHRAVRRALLFFLVIFLVVAGVYRRAPVAFLRAESGFYLSLAYADAAAQKKEVRSFFTGSYGGHYTPLAFLGEFVQAKIGGTSRAFWRWRQILGVSVVGAALFGLVVVITSRLSLPRAQQLAIAAALSSVMLFQPAMIDFVTWPFMILQLAWIGLSAGALFFVIKTVSTEEKPVWPWLACSIAYAALHVSGLGLVTVAGTAACLVFCAFRKRRVRLLRPCALMLVLALLHSWMMFQAVPESLTTLRSTDFFSAAKSGLGFVFNFVVAGWRSLTFTSVPVPDPRAIEYCWPLGILLVGFTTAGLVRRIQQTRADSTEQRFVTTLVLLFAATGFATMVTLIAGRQIASGKDASLVLPYFTVFPRYIIPAQFLFVGAVIPALVWFARRAPRAVVLACWLLVPATIMSQLAYQKNAMPFLTVGVRASHYTSWRLLVAAARECRAAGLGLPNFSLASLTREFSEADVETFLPLLSHDLGLPPGETIQLVPLSSYLGDRERYRVAPSVSAFEQKLELGRD